MGNCCKSTLTTIRATPIYSHKVSISIKEYDQVGHQTGLCNIRFKLPRSISAVSEQLCISDATLWTSFCMLPGIDPRGELKKPCQDLCFFTPLGNTFLFSLYDGHGHYGHTVVNYCKELTNSYCASNFGSAVADPLQFLQELTQRIDTSLLSSELNTQCSGSTLVLVLVLNNTLYSAGVGDSRAVLATSKSDTHSPVPEIKSMSNTQLNTPRYSANLHAMQLTQDQKPEDPEELKRILASGGRVEQMLDEWGNHVGSYRVWKQTEEYPGLAMSRSLGDGVAKSVGVISTPIVTEHNLSADTDFFFVMASDGVWDVMTNAEVIGFVQFYRSQCLKGKSRPQKLVSPKNASIAQLLCAEARARWLRLIEEEDVPIDDISCVVVEFSDTNSEVAAEPKEPLTPLQTNRMRRAKTVNNARVFDPRRASVVASQSFLMEASK